ncbi:MAG: M20 family metallopeptidase [Nisaea sp.]|uniref:M20 family metallopeptidase n=1 Tax=Nisaea sp. TaxID=2024842 RepID=UPI001B06D59F|nr:M20 family metallopeptidase [Nisaea sp.]MBO6559532.1 M20 family metallopeptidase [Nisaea sp.]
MSTDSSAQSNTPKIEPEEILDGILDWVEAESPTTDAAAVNKVADKVQGLYAGLGLAIERTAGRDGYGDIIRARTENASGEKGILVLCHIDTVHPVGVKEGELKIRREGDEVYGPGIYDMKSGAYLPYYAYRHLQRLGRTTRLPVTFLYVSEEEVGSPISQEIIEEEGRKAKYVLVTEPARDGGKVVVSRKGVGRFVMKITGRPAHAGAKHEDGRSAISELANQIKAIDAMVDYERGITTNVGLISGGTAVNVVARDVVAEIDLRVLTKEDGEEMTAKMLALKAQNPDVTVEVTGGMNRPPFEATPESLKLFEHARKCAAEAGLELEATVTTGGGSDGNFTAALGVPTLDGLGADGAGAHTLEEKIYFSSLEPRAKMWVRLLETLE